MLLRAAGISFAGTDDVCSASTAQRSISGFRSAYEGVAQRSENCELPRPSMGDCLALSVPSEPAHNGWSRYSTGHVSRT